MLCIMVAGVGVLTVRLHRMRDRLRRQKVELEAALAHIHRLATHDDLTGLVNRRHMQELLENERMRLERSEQDWCVALIDLDHFKSVNDAHGHAIGDEVLRALSRHAHALIRRTDVLARWGGEEFVLLLPNTPIGMATISLERLREHFHAQPAGGARHGAAGVVLGRPHRAPARRDAWRRRWSGRTSCATRPRRWGATGSSAVEAERRVAGSGPGRRAGVTLASSAASHAARPARHTSIGARSRPEHVDSPALAPCHGLGRLVRGEHAFHAQLLRRIARSACPPSTTSEK